MSNETQELLPNPLANVLTENELCDLLGLKLGQVGILRRDNQLPFVKISRTSRLYLVDELMKWFQKRLVILDSEK
jgi:hypothetical protein